MKITGQAAEITRHAAKAEPEELPRREGRRRWRVGAGVLALILVFALEVVTTVRQESLTWDEGDHIFAGYMSWKKVDFGINPEHPPLVKALAAIPLLPMRLKVPDPKRLTSFKDEAYF